VELSQTVAMKMLLKAAYRPRWSSDAEVDSGWGMAQLWAAAAIFLMLSHEYNRKAFDATPGMLQRLSEILHRQCTRGKDAFLLQDTLRWLSAGALLMLATSNEKRTLELASYGTGEFCRAVAMDASNSVRLRLRAAVLYVHLATHAEEIADPQDGRHEVMLVVLLDSGHEELVQFATKTCAFLANKSERRKESLDRARAIPSLLAAIPLLDPMAEDGRRVALMALLNLSLDYINQRVICKHGLQLLLQVTPS
jgi:hypothetical protein